MSGSRVLGNTCIKSTPPEKEKSSWYEVICNKGKVPVIAGNSTKAVWPLSDEYSRP
ncbi:hypothetical protein DPMN_187682 [Dreissena polymorpha]|uniref:Uncharacterized protein n=1 Tax=Dreissena polymorpha TaxID=45954 RepID=A0A9D4DS25_DREPO|nr:hypothetical protein DPMN_183014 [Dreissena polymorpha]KAH3753052.1 hypothetical protein DPMN_187682 [Dreissena polymorpha]